MWISYDPDKDPSFELHKGVPTLKEMQEVVGGLIEVVHLWDEGRNQVHLYVNEEGLYLCNPTMILLSEIYDHFPIRGPVVFTKTNMMTGNTVSLTKSDVEQIRESFGQKYAITSAGILPLLEIV